MVAKAFSQLMHMQLEMKLSIKQQKQTRLYMRIDVDSLLF